MTKAGIWKTDWFLRVAVAIPVVLANRAIDLILRHERVAGAPDYGRKQDIVHRDSEPASVVYALECDSPKFTDFGTARITGSSRTRAYRSKKRGAWI